jgi:hypothetical protein
MEQHYNIKGMITKIKALKKAAVELKAMSQGMPTIVCNVDRILTNVRVLEINITEAADALKD